MLLSHIFYYFCLAILPVTWKRAYVHQPFANSTCIRNEETKSPASFSPYLNSSQVKPFLEVEHLQTRYRPDIQLVSPSPGDGEAFLVQTGTRRQRGKECTLKSPKLSCFRKARHLSKWLRAISGALEDTDHFQISATNKQQTLGWREPLK